MRVFLVRAREVVAERGCELSDGEASCSVHCVRVDDLELLGQQLLRGKRQSERLDRPIEARIGIDGLFVGVPAILGAGGMEKVWEIDLTEKEQAELNAYAAAVQELVDILGI